MRSFASLKEPEVLALAVSLEEEDAKIYDAFADGLRAHHPDQAQRFDAMRVEEEGHRRRLIELYRVRFGEHLPLIRREDVKGFVARPAVWLARPLGLATVRRTAAVMEAETKRYYESAAARTT